MVTATVSAPPAVADCCAVLVHYRCEDDLRACVQSLGEHAPGVPIVVVENGSGPGVASRLRGLFAHLPHLEVVDAGGNRGFGAGCNRGIAAALARWPDLRSVLLLNPDAELTPGSLQALRETARRRGAGIVGGHVTDRDGATWYANGRIPRWTLSRCHAPAPAGQTEFPTAFVTGALMLVDADLLRAGLRFDETFFLYAEDMDLCQRAAAAGASLWVTTRAVVRHREGGSQRGEPAVLGNLRATQLQHLTRSKALFARKHLGWPQRLTWLATAVLVRPLLGLGLARGRPAFLAPYFRGLWQGLTARLSP